MRLNFQVSGIAIRRLRCWLTRTLELNVIDESNKLARLLLVCVRVWNTCDLNMRWQVSLKASETHKTKNTDSKKQYGPGLGVNPQDHISSFCLGQKNVRQLERNTMKNRLWGKLSRLTVNADWKSNWRNLILHTHTYTALIHFSLCKSSYKG